MNHPAGRVLTLLELLQSGGVRTAAELAERLGVDARTVRRYVDHLLELEIPVESVRGRYGGYRLARGYRLPPLMLGDDEALAVLLGLLAGRRSGLTAALGAALGAAGETAGAKIRRVLPTRLSERLRSVLDNVAFTGEGVDQDAALDATVLLTVADAVAEHRPITVGYTGRDGVRGDRTLHPYAIVSHGDRWYVRALDPRIGEERMFRLDRIDGARTLPGLFEPPEMDHDAGQRLIDSFATADYRYEVAIRVRGTVEQIRTRFPASVARIQPLGDAQQSERESQASREEQAHSDRQARPEGQASDERQTSWQHLAIRAEHLDWIPPTLAALDLPFEIEHPPELRDLVIAFADRLTARARSGRSDPSDRSDQSARSSRE